MTDRTRRQPIVTAAIAIGTIWSLCLVIWALSGQLGVVQSSKVTEIGICLATQDYSPTTIVPAQTGNLTVCGIVSGATKRMAWFNILQGSQAVAQGSGTVGPGVFFVSDLRWYAPLLPGRYRVEARYGTMPVISSEFEVR